jgi:hypothetical protein
VKVPKEEEKKETEQLALTVDKSLFDQLHQLARLDGVDVYHLVTEMLKHYVADNEYKLDSQLNPIDAADKADRLFALAVKLQAVVAESPIGSKERVRAENDFIAVLQKAAALFAQITMKLKGTDIEKHIQLRMSQITALCDDQLAGEKKAKE